MSGSRLPTLHKRQPGPRPPEPRTYIPIHPAFPNSYGSLKTHPTNPETRKLIGTIKTQANAAVSPATHTSNGRSWTLFDEFSKHVNQIFYMPLSTEATTLFIAFLFEQGLAIANIRSHLSSISYYHCMAGFPTPTDSFFMNKLLKGALNLFPSIDQHYPPRVGPPFRPVDSLAEGLGGRTSQRTTASHPHQQRDYYSTWTYRGRPGTTAGLGCGI